MKNKYIIDIGLEEAAAETVNLSKELLVLRLAFGKLKEAISNAVAPAAAAFVSLVSKAVFLATRVTRVVGKIVEALFGVRVATQAVEKSAVRTGKALKRSLAGFDQINRLESDTGGGSVVTETQPIRVDRLSPELQAIVDKVLALIAPLQNIDFTALEWAIARLKDAFRVLGSEAGQAVQWIWLEILVPMVQWALENLIPVLGNSLAAAVRAVTAVLLPAGEGFDQLWQALKPVTEFIGKTAVMVLDQFRRAFVYLTQTFTEKSGMITAIFSNIAQAVSGLWEFAGPVMDQLRVLWVTAFEDIGQVVARIAGFIIDSLYGVTEFLAGAFTGDWSRAWKGLGELLKGSVNVVIGLLNALLTGLTAAVNGVVRVVNKLHITVPDWVPGLGGKSLGFNLKTVSAPQIPYLAKGAVLPANRPFLAMVGDQRHGTNVEAPLSTIQEAVALVMNDQLSAMMEGFNATVSELRQLHNTVSAIEIGDTVIGRAARRYERKLAVMRGGQF